MSWIYLLVAIGFEVAGTLSLKVASTADRARTWWTPVLGGYLLAFTALSLALAEGMPLGVAYGLWTAIGVALTAVLGRLLFGERLTATMGLGIALIAGGVLLVELARSLSV